MEKNHLDKLLKKDIQDNGDNADIQQDINGEKGKLEKIKNSIKQLYRDLGALYVHEKILEYVHKLQSNKEYPQSVCLQYQAYHFLIGSTPDPEKSPYLDFPGEYSVEKFLDELLEQASQQRSSKQEKEEK